MATISIQAHHLSIAYQMIPPLGREHSHGKTRDSNKGQDPINSWKAGPGEVMTVENLFIYSKSEGMTQFNICHTLVENLLNSLIAMIFLSFTPSSQNLKYDDHLWARLAKHGSIFLFL